MMRLRPRFLFIGALAALLAGCGAEVPVTAGTIPDPLVEALPLTVGVVYGEDFTRYSYTEKATGTDWSINLGDSTTRMFDRVLSSAFAKVVQLDALPAADHPEQGVDLVLKPSVDEYAFLTPEDSGVDFYSVSIRFQVQAFAPNGAPLDQWDINSYGRTRSKALNAKESLGAATDLALRDAAATMALDFKQRAQIRALLPGAAGT
jgi:hypothetical protein